MEEEVWLLATTIKRDAHALGERVGRIVRLDQQRWLEVESRPREAHHWREKKSAL